MISHDTQLCLTEPEGAGEMEGEEQDKEREDEGKEETKRERRRWGWGGGLGQAYYFSREKPLSIYQNQHPTQSPRLSIRARVVLPQAVHTEFADVHTIRPGPKCGN